MLLDPLVEPVEITIHVLSVGRAKTLSIADDPALPQWPLPQATKPTTHAQPGSSGKYRELRVTRLRSHNFATMLELR